MIERRAQQRFPLRLQVLVRNLAHDSAEQQMGESLNVSSRGLYLLMPKQSFEAGRRVEVSFWLPVGGSTGSSCVQGSGRVVRVEPQAGEKMGMAVALEHVNWLRVEATG